MIFSLLVPTRARRDLRLNLLLSLRRTTKNPKNIEIIFAIDDDDSISKDHINGLIPDFTEFKIHHHARPRSEFINGDYYDWLVQFATGKYLWAVGDDVEFLINDWDEIIAKKIENCLFGKPDRILCLGVKDNTPKPKVTLPKFPCFPLVTREAYNFFGFVVHPQVPTWGADYLIYLLYNSANRYADISDKTYLRHVSWHVIDDPRTPDGVAKRIQQIFAKMQHIPQYNIDRLAANLIPKQSKDLLNYIEEFARKEKLKEAQGNT